MWFIYVFPSSELLVALPAIHSRQLLFNVKASSVIPLSGCMTMNMVSLRLSIQIVA